MAAWLLASCHPSTQLAVVTGVGRIEAIAFGRVIVGETSTAPLKIENIQGSAFHLTASPSIAGPDSSDFLVVEAPPLSVPQAGSVTGELSFSPLGAGQRSGQLTAATDNTSASVLSGALTGVGVAPESVTLSVDPTELNFGQVEILTSKMLLLKLTNTGVDPAPLQPFRISGTGGTAYTVALDGESTDAPDPLAAGASLTMAVTFMPLSFGSLTGVLQIQACKLCAPLSVPLAGIGFTPGLVFVPPTLTFSAIRGQVQTQSIELLNDGNATAMVTGVGFSEGDVTLLDGGGPFSAVVRDTLPTHLLTGQSLSFTVTYAPTLAETAGEVDQFELSAQTSGANVEQTPAQLTGAVTLDCALVVPASLFFGYAQPPSLDPVATLIIGNLGVDPCPITQLAFVPDSDPGFGFQSVAPAKLIVPGFGSASLPMVFAPADTSSPWLRQGTLTMQTSQPGLPTASVALSGYTQSTPYANHSPWPRFCHDNGNSCLSDVDTSLTGPTLRWRTKIAICGGFSPPGGYAGIYWQGPAIGGDGTIYELGCDGQLNAIDRSGAILWSSLAGPSADQEPIVSDVARSYALVPTVTAASQILVGTLPWLGANGLLDNGSVAQYFAFNSAGVRLWGDAIGAGVMASSPALRPDQTAMLTQYGTSGVASYAGGTALPPFPCASCSGTGVIAVDGTSYWTNAPGDEPITIFQILPDGGPGYSLSPPSICGIALSQAAPTVLLMRGSEIYLSGSEILSDGGTLMALGAFEADDLTLDWQYCDRNRFIGSAVALGPDGGVLLSVLYGERLDEYDMYYPTLSGYGWVDPPGTLRWLNTTPPASSDVFKAEYEAFPAIGAEGTVYFTTGSAGLIALNSADGSILWSYTFDGGTIGTSPPAIGADGTIYFQDSDGYLDAVR